MSYLRAGSAVFTSMHDEWGDFSNMASGMPITIAGVHIGRSENLYQACRYPHLPHLQAEIIKETNPMKAKLLSKKNYKLSRADWDGVCVDVMRWCLRVKLKQNWERMSSTLAMSGSLDIAEESARHDQFWGTVESRTVPTVLVGDNHLGCLWMEIRSEVSSGGRTALTPVPLPLSIPNRTLLGKAIPIL